MLRLDVLLPRAALVRRQSLRRTLILTMIGIRWRHVTVLLLTEEVHLRLLSIEDLQEDMRRPCTAHLLVATAMVLTIVTTLTMVLSVQATMLARSLTVLMCATLTETRKGEVRLVAASQEVIKSH